MPKQSWNNWFKAVLMVAGAVFTTSGWAQTKPFAFTIIHTNDLHSQLQGSGFDYYFTEEPNDGDPVKGHYARLAYLIKKIKREQAAADIPVLTVDAGDFFSGSLFHALAPNREQSYVPELQFFHDMGFDAVSLGNHEFDAGETGLATMLNKARASGLNVELIASNLQLKSSASPLTPYVSKLPTGGPLPALRPYLIRELNTADGRRLRVGILGYVGPDAALVSAATRQYAEFVGFDEAKSKVKPQDLTDLTKKQVAHLRSVEKVDVVVLVIHAGDPEDRKLAESVPGVDIIISGHTHQDYDRVVNGTILAQTGCYGQGLGVMDLVFDQGKVQAAYPKAVRRLMVDDKVPADAEYLAKIETYKAAVSSAVTSHDFTYDSPIFTLNRDLPKENHLNAALGQHVSSAVLKELNKELDSPTDIYFTAMGLVRSSLNTLQGQLTIYQYSDVFRILGVGFAPDLTLGYPIVTFYLTPKELKQLIQAAEIYSWRSSKFALAFSDSLQFQIRSYALPFLGRLKDVTLHGQPLSQYQRLIKVSTNLFVAEYVKKVPALTHGWIKVRPKDADGRELTEFEFNSSLPREFDLLARRLHELRQYP